MKNRVRYAVFAFLVEMRGFEPRSTRPYSALSTRLVGDWIVSRFGSPTNLASMISCWQQSYREIRLRCLFFWRRLPREQKTSGRRADLNYAARANSILELFWLFFAFNFNFRWWRSRAYDVLIPPKTECRIQKHPQIAQQSSAFWCFDYTILYRDCNRFFHSAIILIIIFCNIIYIL